MARRRIPLACLIASIALGVGCLVDIDYDQTSFLCADLACPDGFSCQGGECVADGVSALPGAFRRRLDLVDNGADALTNFPLLVRLDASRIDYAAAGANGASVRFTDLDGDLVPHEIDSWDTSGVSTVWVRVPEVIPGSTDDAILLYWGSASPPAALPATGVWDQTFVGVWHLDDDPGGGAANAILESTSAGANGTTNPEMTAGSVAPGQIGSSLHFIASQGDAVTVADRPELELPRYTWSCWLRGDTLPATGMGNGQPIYNADDQFNFSWNHVSADSTQAAAHRDNGGFLKAQITSTLVSDQWYFIAATYNGSELTIYLDGQAEATVIIGDPVPRDGPLGIGNDPAAAFYTGFVDDVHIASTPRSPSWLASMYAAAIDSDTLRMIDFGALESL